MATKLFLRDTAFTDFAISGVDEKQADTTAGTSVATSTTNTTAGGNHIMTTVSAGGNIVQWFYGPLEAVTISGTVSMNLWMAESNMSANVGAAIVIQEMSNTGTFVADIVAQANANHADGVELAVTTRALRDWTATPTSTNLSAGNYIKLELHGDGVGTMGGGHTFSLGYNDDVASADGDSWVQFTETITKQSGTPKSFPNRPRYRNRIIR